MRCENFHEDDIVMYILSFSNNFRSCAEKLDRDIKDKLEKQLEILVINPLDSRLHSKILHGELKNLYSIRIGHDYRVIFKLLDNYVILLVKIRHRKDVYR